MKTAFQRLFFKNKKSRYFSALMLVVISFSCHSQNILKNPGFENLGKDWTIWNTGQWQSDVVKSGKYALKVTQKKARFSGATQTIVFPKNVKKLEVSGWMKTEDVIQGDSSYMKANIAIAIEDSLGNGIGDVPGVGQQTGNSDWIFFKKSYEVPEGGKQVRFVAFLNNCVGTAWFDDLEIKFYDKKGRTLMAESKPISDIKPVNMIYPQWKLREDFNQMVESLRTHPALYEFISKSEFEALVDSQYNKINDSMKLYEFYSICSPIVARVGCLHTQLTRKGADIFPFPVFFSPYIYIENDRMFVIKQPDFFPELTAGSEITKINNKPVSEFYWNIFKNISMDGNNKSGKQYFISRFFSMYYYRFYGYENMYTIAYRIPGTDKEIVRNLCAGLLMGNENEIQDDANCIDPKLCFKILKKENTAIITIKSFAYYNNNEYFRKFIDKCFAEISDKQIPNLIIDLRDGEGGDPYCSSYFLTYIMNKPITYYRKGTPFYDNLTTPLFPAAKHYTGVPYILINKGGFSTHGHLNALLKYHKLGVFIGEETGATYSCNASVKEILLKHTNLTIDVAQVTYTVDTEEFPKERGIMPDVEVKPSLKDIIEGKDVVMDYTMQLIINKNK